MLETTRDPKTRKEITFVTGKVEKIYFNKLKEVKTYTGGKQPWTPTHTHSVVVDGTRIGLGLTEKETLRAKAEDGKYHDVCEGMEVSVEITKVGEYQGKPQYDSQSSKVYIVDLSGAVAAPVRASEQGQKADNGSFNKDTTGIETGHAINGAFEWLGGEAKSADYLETAKQIHAITVEMKEYYKATFPKVSAYDAGAASGNAVLNALKIAKAREKGLDAVLTYAKTIVGNIAVPLSDHIRKGKEKPVEPPAPPVDDLEEEVVQEEEEVAPSPAPAKRGRPAKPKVVPMDNDYDSDVPF